MLAIRRARRVSAMMCPYGRYRSWFYRRERSRAKYTARNCAAPWRGPSGGPCLYLISELHASRSNGNSRVFDQIADIYTKRMRLVEGLWNPRPVGNTLPRWLQNRVNAWRLIRQAQHAPHRTSFRWLTRGNVHTLCQAVLYVPGFPRYQFSFVENTYFQLNEAKLAN